MKPILPAALVLASLNLFLGPLLPGQAQSPEDARPRLETLLVDRNLRLNLTGVPESCPLVRLSLLRRDELKPGYGVFTRPVRLDAERGRLITLELGPEFWPHRYAAGDLRLSCYGGDGQFIRSLGNLAPVSLDQAEVQLEFKGFGNVAK